jgi:transcriptional regulator with XRE-family HTH domain
MGEGDVNQRSAGELDIEIGRRLRSRRLELDLSQENVADALGVTFQQLQKYEKGTNRVASSTLCRLAEILDAHPAAFLPRPAGRASGKNAEANSSRARAVLDAFSALELKEQRACLLEMIAVALPTGAGAQGASRAKRLRK